MNFLTLIVAFVVAVVFVVIGFVLGVAYRKRVSEREISSAEEEGKRIINDSIKSAENKKREALLEAKEEIHKNRVEYEREVKDRRGELSKQEQRLQQKEENLERKVESLERKNETLGKKLVEVDQQIEDVSRLKDEQLHKLEVISSYTATEAKHHLISTLESEVTHELAATLKNLEQQFKEDADQKAREYISLAIQRCAADHVAEAAVSVVPLPSDEMKGRIIGREGRNIRTIETLTGVDLIIDDTPEAITLSSFDPVRREVARIALEKLILDGRIHPARIEETIAKARREVDATIKSEGERATFETGIHGLHPEV
ncbi:MAG: Rnase Y domain-containing protein, partial [Oscillospiraceae bacterium]|nr:Rnase Y domain-containing protein [Oscillospiraceae bacterium]